MWLILLVSVAKCKLHAYLKKTLNVGDTLKFWLQGPFEDIKS
jgi:hypothetical protein